MQKQVDEFYKNLKAQASDDFFKDLQPDHLCYRVATRTEYEAKKIELTIENELLTEAEIRGRPIATFKLAKPLLFDGHEVSLLELPAPKSGQTYKTGFEHVEYVLREPFAAFLNRYPELQSQAEIRENAFNHEMVFTFKDLSVKLHYSPLDRVIELEERPRREQKFFVFDLDGTLINSMPEIAVVNREIIESLGIYPPVGTAFGSTFQKIIDQFQIREIDAAEFARRWSDKMISRKAKLFPGVRELLNGIRELKIPMAIWTARDRKSTNAVIDQLELRSYFEEVRTFEDACPKPSVDGLKYLTRGRPAELIYYMGDSDADEMAAQQLGCRFFRETTNHAEILKIIADD